jgi:hypothetical protein
MDPGFAISPSPAGLVLAAVAVALGAPLFSDGLRALRLRRHLSGLKVEPLTPSTNGFAHACGTVALESPLFSPLAGAPCAGFVLEITGEGTSVRRTIEVRRNFRIVDGNVVARVPGAMGRWDLEPTVTRRYAPGEALSENLSALVARIPEVEWLRRGGVAIEIRERALRAGQVCHVVGVARSAESLAYAEEIQLSRTGTDDVVMTAVAAGASVGRAAGSEPALAFHPGEHLDFLLVTDHEPAPERLRLSPMRVAGVVAGPALSMIGLFYLAAVADLLRAVGRS